MTWQVYGWIMLGLAALTLATAGLPSTTTKARPGVRVFSGLLVGCGLFFPIGGHLVGWW